MAAMPSDPASPDEARRLQALHELGILDTEPEDSFDALVDIALQVTGCGKALLSLVDRDRLWFKARAGTTDREAPRDNSFCDHALLGNDVFEVADTTADGRFASHPLVTGAPHIRFYAGVPVHLDGLALGTLCVVDHQAHAPLRPDQRDVLRKLAHVASGLMRSRRAMFELTRERERMADFARASGDWMWECDSALRYTWISQAYETSTGVPVSRWIGQTVVDAPLLDQLGRPLPGGGRLHDLLRRPEPFARALTLQQLDGRQLCVSRSAVPAFDAQGRLQGWRGTTRDVSARMAASALAREREQLLAKLSEQVPGVLFQYRRDADGGTSYLYASDRVRELFGVELPPGGRGADPTVPYRLLHPDDRAGFAESFRESAQALQPWVREYRILRDGELRWVETRATPERLPDGATLWHGFSTDVTERKQIEGALRDGEQRWEMAASATGIGIAELDLDSGLMRLDRRACVNHGLQFPAVGYTARDWLQSIHADDRDAVQQALAAAIDDGGRLDARVRVRRPDGGQPTLEIIGQATRNPDGRVVAVVGTCRDVTQQVAHEQLLRDKDSAERANRAKSEFLSRMSHELRTPLNGILGFAQLMALDRVHPLAPDQQRRLDSVHRAGRHLLGLINDVLDLARIEQEDFSLQVESVDVSAALDACLTLIQPLAREAGIGLPRPPMQAHWVRADRRALEQVLMNLLSNAVKFTPREGAVLVRVGLLAAADPQVLVEVQDTGPGISATQQQRLFQDFSQLPNQSETQHADMAVHGAGLGLALCRRLVKQMKGEMGVCSTAGGGSTFWFRMPVSRETRTQGAAEQSA